jgi:hypothetical protein
MSYLSSINLMLINNILFCNIGIRGGSEKKRTITNETFIVSD